MDWVYRKINARPYLFSLFTEPYTLDPISVKHFFYFFACGIPESCGNTSFNPLHLNFIFTIFAAGEIVIL